MMQKITITAVESKTGTSDKGPWTKTTVTGADGLKASGFDPGLAKLQPGAVIEAEIEVKGKFTNIGKFSLISQGQPPTTGTKPAIFPNGKSYGKSLEVVALEEEGRNHRERIQRVSIEKQVALKELGEMVRAGKANEMMALWTAAIRHMIGIGDISPVVTKAPPTGEIESPPVFESPSNLVNYYMKHGLSWLDQQAALNIKTPADIKDLADANRVLANITARREAVKEQK